MAQLYFNDQLIANSSCHGILSHQLANEEIVIHYTHHAKKYYTVIMYDDRHIHSMIINVKGDDLENGDVLVEYTPFEIRRVNYGALVCIYEQPTRLPLPNDDFDMEKFTKDNKLKSLYTIAFTVLQKIEKKPNIYSNRVFNTKLKQYKK